MLTENRIMQAWRNGERPRRVMNLLPQSSSGNPSTGCRLWGTSSGWTFTQTNGTVTVSGDTLTCASTASACRAFAARDVSLVSGRYYCFSVELVELTTTAPNAIINTLSFTTAAAWGSNNYAHAVATAKAGERYGIIMKANTTAAHNVRVGIGTGAGQTISSGAITMRFRNPMVHEVLAPDLVSRPINDGSSAASVFAPSEFFGPAEYCPAADVVAFDYTAAHYFQEGTSGRMVEKVLEKINVHGYASGAVIGHSMATDESDFPHQLRILMPESAIRYRGFSSGDVSIASQVPAMLTEILEPTETDPRIVKPQWIAIMAGINDILAGTLTVNPIPRLIDDMVGQLDRIKRANAWPIIVGISGAKGWATYDETKGHEIYIRAYNAWAKDYAARNGYGFLDAYALLSDPADPTAILAAYTADALHPNAVGGYRLASRMAVLIREHFASLAK